MLNLPLAAQASVESTYPPGGKDALRVAEEGGRAPRSKQTLAGIQLAPFHIPEAVSCWMGSCRICVSSAFFSPAAQAGHYEWLRLDSGAQWSREGQLK